MWWRSSPDGLRRGGNAWGFSLHSGRRDEDQNPRPVPPKNGGTRTGHPLVSRKCVPASKSDSRVVQPPSFRHYLIAVEGVVEIDPGGLRGDGNGWGFSLHSGRRDEGQNPRPVPPKNGGTRTGHPLYLLAESVFQLPNQIRGWARPFSSHALREARASPAQTTVRTCDAEHLCE